MEEKIYNLKTLISMANILMKNNSKCCNVYQMKQIFNNLGYEVIKLNDNCFQLKRIED